MTHLPAMSLRARAVIPDGEGRVLFDSREAGAPSKTPAIELVGPLPPHSIENVGVSQVHLLTVELKKGAA